MTKEIQNPTDTASQQADDWKHSVLDLKPVRRMLMLHFGSNVAFTAILAILFELDLLPGGTMAGTDNGLEFALVTVLELLTLCAIPVALRLFKFQRVRRQLTNVPALRLWSLVRMDVLCLLLLANTVLYYLYMNVAFGYMALILVLCLCFVIPTKTRLEGELGQAMGLDAVPVGTGAEGGKATGEAANSPQEPKQVQDETA